MAKTVLSFTCRRVTGLRTSGNVVSSTMHSSDVTRHNERQNAEVVL